MIEILKPQKMAVPSGVNLGFTTRAGGVSTGEFESLNLGFSVTDQEENVQRNRALLFKTIGVDESKLAKPHQVHSANVAMVQEPGEFVDTDALVTHESNIYLTIQTADCLPILIWTTDGEWMGAIHSGWRGTEQKITAETLTLLISGTGYEPDEFFVCVGPGLGACHFEVGPEFETKFNAKYLFRTNGKLHFNNLAAVIDQITQAGIPAPNVEVIDECTYCHPEKYFSHRRDAGRTGRMLAFIGRDE